MQHIQLAFYTQRFFPRVGGLERVVHLWAQALQELGHVVTVVTPQVGAFLPPGATYLLLVAPVRRQALWHLRQADAVVWFNLALSAVPLMWQSRKPVYISHHTGLWPDAGPRPWHQRLKQQLANQMAASHWACSQYLAGFYRRCRVVHSPYDASIFHSNAKTERQSGHLAFVGRLVTDKGVDTLIDALARLRKEGGPRLQLTVAGDGPERQRLQIMAEEGGLGKQVHFAGNLSPMEVANLLRCCETLVVPSRIEPFGTVVAEGLACGCRVITSTAGGLPEAGGGFAQTFAPEDANALANLLRVPALSSDSRSLQAFLAGLTPEATARQVLQMIRNMGQPVGASR